MALEALVIERVGMRKINRRGLHSQENSYSIQISICKDACGRIQRGEKKMPLAIAILGAVTAILIAVDEAGRTFR